MRVGKSLIIAATLAPIAALAVYFVSRGIPSDFELRSREFPYPGIDILLGPPVWRDLGLKESQVASLHGKGMHGSEDLNQLRKLESELTPAQRRRYDQIRLQVADTLALRDPKVVAKLALTNLQKAQLKAIQQCCDEMLKRDREIAVRRADYDAEYVRSHGLTGRLYAQISERPMRIEKINLLERSCVRGILTKKQANQFQEMKGAPAAVFPLQPHGSSYFVE